MHLPGFMTKGHTGYCELVRRPHEDKEQIKWYI